MVPSVRDRDRQVSPRFGKMNVFLVPGGLYTLAEVLGELGQVSFWSSHIIVQDTFWKIITSKVVI